MGYDNTTRHKAPYKVFLATPYQLPTGRENTADTLHNVPHHFLSTTHWTSEYNKAQVPLQTVQHHYPWDVRIQQGRRSPTKCSTPLSACYPGDVRIQQGTRSPTNCSTPPSTHHPREVRIQEGQGPLQSAPHHCTQYPGDVRTQQGIRSPT